MSIRDFTYYGWNKILDIPTSYLNSGSYANNAIRFNDVKTNPTNPNIIYVVGTVGNSLPLRNWFVLRTTNAGKNWELSDFPSNVDCEEAKSLVFDNSGSVYVCGHHAIRKSTTGNPGTWTTVDTLNSISRYTDIKTSVSGGIIAVGTSGSANYSPTTPNSRGIIRGSNNGSSGSFVTLCVPNDPPGANTLHCLEIYNSASIETVLVAGNAFIYRSIVNPIPSLLTSHSGNFTSSSFTPPDPTPSGPIIQMVISGSKIFACEEGDAGSFNKILSSSDNGITWDLADLRVSINTGTNTGIAKDSKNSLYYFGTDGDPSFATTSFFYIRRSDHEQHHTGSYTSIFQSNPSSNVVNERYYASTRIHIDVNDNIYLCAQYGGNSAQLLQWDDPYSSGRAIETNRATLWVGKRTSVSASIGPRMLATSFGYPSLEETGSLQEKFNLNNISEFPHSSGLFQMPNMVLGTKSSGLAGKTDDAIVQKRFIGSFVQVMYPKQEDADVRSYDVAKKPGKLSTDWTFGDIVNVDGKNFDHLALNCSVVKQVSGTLDSILIRMETKPLNDSGFSVEQTTELTISSSYSSETIYRDELHRKDIDYGDLTVSEISWKIPIDLKNVKEIRIAAKQKNGQNDDRNRLLLVLGRFITENQDHKET